MKYSRYNKTKRHRKLKSVDPSAIKAASQTPKNRRKAILKEKARIAKLKEQHVPKKLLNLTQKAAKVTRNNKTKKRGKSLLRVFTNLNEGDETGAKRPVKVLPNVLEQGPYESDVSFVKRLDRLCEKMRSESAVEAKYNLGDEKLGERKMSENKLLKRKVRDKKRKTKKKKGQKDADDFAELNYDFLHF